MNKFFVLGALFLAATGSAIAQTRPIKIVDAATDQAIPGAAITGLHNAVDLTSDRNGDLALPEGTDSVRVVSMGYQPLTTAISASTRSIRLTPLFANLNEVVISADREIRKRSEIPAAIDVISSTVINETKATRLDQLVNKSPGVFMVDLGNEQHSMAMRQPLGYNNLYLYLEDGIPIRTVGDFNHNALIEINQASLERIEVIKGPASSLYGSEAVGGALNFITKAPSPYLSGKVQAEAGTRGYKRTDLGISNTVGKLGVFVGGYYADQDQSEAEHNDFKKAALTLRADYTFNERTKLTTVADYIDYDTDQKGGLDSAHFHDESYQSLYRFTYRKVRALRARSTLSEQWNPNSKTDFTFYYRNSSIKQNPFYSIANIQSDPSKATGQINDDAFQSFGGIVQHAQKFNALHLKWITGISLDHSPATYNAELINVDRDPNGVYYQYANTDSVLTSYNVGLLNSAAYTQFEYQPLPELRIVVAARYDRLDYDFDNHLPSGAYTGAPDAIDHFDHFTPKVGFTWDFGKNRGMYVNYAVGFAPPNITDLYSGVQVPTLQPSTYTNYELGGWVGFADGKGSVEASLYRLDGRNEIVSVRLDNGSYQNQNAGATSHTGVEVGVKYAPINDLSVRIGGTVAKHEYVDYVQQGTDFSGNFMPQAPAYMLNGEVIYKPRYAKGFRIGVECQSLGSYYTDQRNTAIYDGFTVFNARTGYARKHVEAWVNWINVLNTNYAVTVEKTAYGTSYRPGQLSTVTVGLAYNFGQQ